MLTHCFFKKQKKTDQNILYIEKIKDKDPFLREKNTLEINI
jgi:phage-related protein